MIWIKQWYAKVKKKHHCIWYSNRALEHSTWGSKHSLPFASFSYNVSKCLANQRTEVTPLLQIHGYIEDISFQLSFVHMSTDRHLPDESLRDDGLTCMRKRGLSGMSTNMREEVKLGSTHSARYTRQLVYLKLGVLTPNWWGITAHASAASSNMQH